MLYHGICLFNVNSSGTFLCIGMFHGIFNNAVSKYLWKSPPWAQYGSFFLTANECKWYISCSEVTWPGHRCNLRCLSPVSYERQFPPFRWGYNSEATRNCNHPRCAIGARTKIWATGVSSFAQCRSPPATWLKTAVKYLPWCSCLLYQKVRCLDFWLKLYDV